MGNIRVRIHSVRADVCICVYVIGVCLYVHVEGRKWAVRLYVQDQRVCLSAFVRRSVACPTLNKKWTGAYVA